MNRRVSQDGEQDQNGTHERPGKRTGRGFTESVDLSFTIKDVDLKNPSNRIRGIRLPEGRGKDVTIAMFATR